MSTHKRKKDEADAALDALSTGQILALAVEVRAMWRNQVARGAMQLDPARMRAYDKDIAELQALHKGS